MFPVFITYLMSMNKTNTTKVNKYKKGQKVTKCRTIGLQKKEETMDKVFIEPEN